MGGAWPSFAHTSEAGCKRQCEAGRKRPSYELSWHIQGSSHPDGTMLVDWAFKKTKLLTYLLQASADDILLASPTLCHSWLHSAIVGYTLPWLVTLGL